MHSNKEQRVWAVYLIVAVFQLAGEGLGLDWLAESFKILLMPTLVAYLLAFTPQSPTRITMLVALIGAWLGDCFLIYGNETNYFLMGMAAFFGTQLFYIITFVKTGTNTKIYKWPKMLAAVVLLVLCGVSLSVIIPKSGELGLFLLIYSAVLIAMGITAILRFGKTSQASFLVTVIGALLFITSDTLIAFLKFVIDLEPGHFLVMLTYISAQGLIVYGYRLHIRKGSPAS